MAGIVIKVLVAIVSVAVIVLVTHLLHEGKREGLIDDGYVGERDDR